MKGAIHWAYLIDVSLVFVVIPCTYVLNREVTKQIIVVGNWYQGIKSVFCSKRQSNNQVNPMNDNIPISNQQPVSNSSNDILRQASKRVSKRNPYTSNRPTTPPPLSGVASPPQQSAMTIDIANLHRVFKHRIGGSSTAVVNVSGHKSIILDYP